MVVLALDIGTSSVRASLYKPTLQPLRAARRRYRWTETRGGAIETDAHYLSRVVASTIDEVLSNWRTPIDAVATAAFWHSLMGVDENGNPTTPVIPWSDTRADDEADALRRRLDERRVHARTGCRLHASYWPARLQWFRRHDARAFSRTARWVSFCEWLEARWLGRVGVSVSQASGTGLMRQNVCQWDGELLRACGIDPASLTPIINPEDRDARLSRRLATRWPALATSAWIPAVGDGASNNVGAGCVTRDRATLMIGTSGALRVLWRPEPSERVSTPFGLWRYRLDRERIVVGGALSNGGNVREWLVRTVRVSKDTEAAARAMEPDAHGLTILPFLAGTRSPGYLTHARGVIRGLSLATTPAGLLRAAMEAVGYRFAILLRELERVTTSREIVAAGGALEQSSAWTEILADVLSRPITTADAGELTSRGAAALALEQLGQLDIDRLRPPPGQVIRPKRGHHQIYRAGFRRHLDLGKRLEGEVR
jgi:gluconokinase